MDLMRAPELPIRLDILYNYFVTGEDNKATFSLPGDTRSFSFNYCIIRILRNKTIIISSYIVFYEICETANFVAALGYTTRVL